MDIEYDKALQLSDEDEEKPVRLKDVGDLFCEEYEDSFSTAFLERAIAAYEAALKLMPDGHSCQADLHTKLGQSLFN